MSVNVRWELTGGKHGSPGAGGYSDPPKVAMLGESLEPPRGPFCPSGNPVEGAEFYRGRGLGKGRRRDREWLVSVGTRPGKDWGLMGGWRGEEVLWRPPGTGVKNSK